MNDGTDAIPHVSPVESGEGDIQGTAGSMSPSTRQRTPGSMANESCGWPVDLDVIDLLAEAALDADLAYHSGSVIIDRAFYENVRMLCAQVRRVRAEHSTRDDKWCDGCELLWPCATARVLGEAP